LDPFDPGDIGRLAVEHAHDGLSQPWEGGAPPPATRLPHREDPLHPAISRGVVSALPQLAPAHRTPQGPVGAVVGGLYAGFHDQCPQSTPCPRQRMGERPCLVFPGPALVEPLPQPRLPGRPGPRRRWRLRPGHQALPCGQHPAAKAGPLRFCPFRQPPRPPEQLGQTRLPAMEPWLVHRLLIADHQLCPGGDQRLEGGVAPARLHRAPRHGGVDQHPPPGPPVLRPAGLGKIMHARPSGLLDDLVGRAGAQVETDPLRAHTSRGLDLDHLGRLPQGLAMAWMPGPRPGGPLRPTWGGGGTQGGSEEGGRSAGREFCCPRASRSASRASRVLSRAACCRVTVSR
jgi:hypothetical protein